MGMTVDTYDYNKATEIGEKKEAGKTTAEVANEPVDWKDKSAMEGLRKLFQQKDQEKNLFQSEKTEKNADLASRVAALEEKYDKITSRLQTGLDQSISQDPQLMALLNNGAVNFNPSERGKKVFVEERAIEDGAKLEAASA